jgi:anti-anti-sigma factor
VLDVELEAVRLQVPFAALDLGTVDEFRRWVREQLRDDASAGSTVLLDLGDVEFVMAAGIQALLDLEAELADRSRTLGVVGAAPIVVRVLDICGVAERWILT